MSSEVCTNLISIFKGAFNNCVDQISSNFDPLPDPPSSFQRNYWMHLGSLINGVISIIYWGYFFFSSNFTKTFRICLKILHFLTYEIYYISLKHPSPSSPVRVCNSFGILGEFLEQTASTIDLCLSIALYW